ncbi:MAG TPA: ABC transporter permease [Gemmatimonadaceae bacterium]|nr:ABC transporter permease [Gemmatimonadaceae bacterium]
MSAGGIRRIMRLGEGRRGRARALDDELEFHIEKRTERLVSQGLAPEAARAEAMRQFGNLSTVRDECLTIDADIDRHARRAQLWEEFRGDVAYAFRTLAARPGFTAIIVLTLALGIGANTAIFTLIDAVMLRRLPVAHPMELVALGDPGRVNSSSQGSPRADLYSNLLYLAVRDSNPFVSGLLASGSPYRLDVISSTSAAAKTDGSAAEAEHPRGRLVSGNYFDVLGVRAQIGRPLRPDDDAPGAEPAMVISDGYWERRFGRDRGVLGRTLSVNSTPFTIVGVAAAGFQGEIVGQSIDLWLPLSTQPMVMLHRDWLRDPTTSFLLLLGRRAPGVTVEQVQAGLTPRVRRWVEAEAKLNGNTRTAADAPTMPVPIGDGSKGFSRTRVAFRAPLMVLMVAVGLILLIVCANVANLLLARAAAREKEIGVRMALGAGRTRLARQLLTESLVLGAAGGALGLLVAQWGTAFLLRLASRGPSPLPLDTHLDVRVLGFVSLLTLGAAVLFGLAPALRATRVELAATLKANSRALAGVALGGGARFGLGKGLVMAQVALSLLLLVGAGLLARSIRNLLVADLGLARDELVIAEVDLERMGIKDEARAVFIRQCLDRVVQVPGVAAVSASENGIFSGTESESSLAMDGVPARSSDDSLARYDQVGPGYFHTIGSRILQGRDFLPSDATGSQRVAILNETMAKHYFPKGDAVGHTFHIDSTAYEIVGIATDAQDHEVQAAPVRRFYLAFMQNPNAIGSLRFEVRTHGDPAALVAPIKRALLEVNPTMPIDAIDPLSSLVRDSVAEERLLATLASVFGALALSLAALGLYGVMAYTIARRTGEFGLRMALGAEPRDVRRLVLRETLGLAAIGVVIGLAVSLAATRFLASQLFGVTPADPVTIVGALIVIALCALTAGLVPAVRAARVAPLEALRQE